MLETNNDRAVLESSVCDLCHLMVQHILTSFEILPSCISEPKEHYTQRFMYVIARQYIPGELIYIQV